MPKKELDCQSLIKQMWNFLQNNGKNLSNKNLHKLNQCIEKNNIDDISKTNEYDNLYPNIGDPNFNNKIANKQEFINTKYPVRDKKDFKNIVNISKTICNNTEFELSAHQMFIRNFMSCKDDS